MKPAVSVRNFVPSSSVVGSFAAAPCGVAALEKMWHGHDPAPPVVNDHETGPPLNALPARSVPLTEAVYDAFEASALFGVNVAVFVAVLYTSVAGTVWFAAFFNVNAIELGFIGSSNVATTGSETETPVAPLAGLRPATLGGVVSCAAWSLKTMSTK